MWQDKNLVQFLTTAHNTEQKTMKERRRPKAYSPWLKKLVAEVWLGEGKRVLSLPTYSVDYNNHMGGVDRHDQLRSYTSTQLKAFRSWFALFFFLLDAAIINAYLLCLDIHRSSNDPRLIKHRNFRRALAWLLVIEGANALDAQWTRYLIELKEQQPQPRYKGKLRSGAVPTGNTSQARDAGYIGANWHLPDKRLAPGNHQPTRAFQTTKYCAYCRYLVNVMKEEHSIKRTRFCCSLCGPNYPLCALCQDRFHSLD